MVDPTENERIEYGLVAVAAAKGAMGVVREYDILFTERGIAFAVVKSGLKMAAGVAGAVTFGMIGALVADGAVTRQAGKIREQFKGMSVPQILALNEKSFYLPYTEVTEASLKRGLTGISKMDISIAGGKYHCEFSKDQYEVAQFALTAELAAKIKE